jgi:tetratricopeptide (TPR) repeat protein
MKRRSRITQLCLCIIVLGVTGYQTGESSQDRAGQPEAISLLGKPLYSPPLPEERKKELEANLARAKADYEQKPDDPERLIWLGRRTAYLGRYREAIQIYTRGIEKHSNYAKLYRHRGHRYITIREFDKAIADLEKAALLIRGVPDEIEPDGMPNKFNIPTSTSHFNIWYHLGLAYYLKGDFKNALRCYVECMKFSKNDDALCATSHWLYMTYRRLERGREAAKVLEPIHKEMKILENTAYHHLLLMYKGQMSPESLLESARENDLDMATVGYGVGNWHLYNGQVGKAREVFQKVIEGPNWAAFGYIAAEADLKRLQ